MQIYFPIAEININFILIVGIGFLSGMLSNILGIGGGFVTTPYLIAIGVPPYIATACSSHQIVGSSFVGTLTRLKPLALDFKLAIILAIFGIVGSYFGIMLVKILQEIGYADIFISFTYIIVMFVVMCKILIKIFFEKCSKEQNTTIAEKLPIVIKFSSSEKKISIVFLGSIGIFVGILTGIMGIGGGIIMIPIMTYTLAVDKTKIIGTSLMQIFFITIFVTAMNIYKTHSVDFLLGTVLIIGGIFGSFVGGFVSKKIKFDYINFMLALLIICVLSFFTLNLMKTPKIENMFILEAIHM